jgi:hypothetical protein
MQVLDAEPREALTVAQVTDLIQSPSMTVDFGADLLDVNLGYLADITEDVVGGSIGWSLNNAIHRTCRLQLSRRLNWGDELVRPWQTLSDGAITAKFYRGVFALTTPERPIGETPETYDAAGFDRLYLLQREVGADYTVASGVTYRQALLDVFAAAGLSGAVIDGSAADDVLPEERTWLLVPDDTSDPDQTDTPVTWLRIVNDLNRAINFRSCWADDLGQYRCQAYQSPEVRAPEYVFDADDLFKTIVGEERRMVEDTWKVPNRWVFRWSNGGTGTEGNGIYTVDQSDVVDGDALGRTLVWSSVVDYEAASQAKLVELGERRVAADKRVSKMFDVTTGPFPAAGHADVFTYSDAAVGGLKVQALSWSMTLDGGDVSWQWEGI